MKALASNIIPSALLALFLIGAYQLGEIRGFALGYFAGILFLGLKELCEWVLFPRR